MSNTAVVTPVAAVGGAGIAAAVIGGCILGLAAAASWVCRETDDDRKAITEYREARRREFLENPFHATDLNSVREAWPQLKAENLYITNPESLIRSAQNLGYRLEPLADVKKSLVEQPYILLQKTTGERLALSYNDDRRIVLTTAGDDLRLSHLVRQHTVERALDHLQKKGLTIQTTTLPGGELQILARERTSKRKDGLAEIKAQVRNDGTAWIDVDRLKSDRCREIVQEFAEAVGGKVTEMKMRGLSFQLPGEPVKTKIRT